MSDFDACHGIAIRIANNSCNRPQSSKDDVRKLDLARIVSMAAMACLWHKTVVREFERVSLSCSLRWSDSASIGRGWFKPQPGFRRRRFVRRLTVLGNCPQKDGHALDRLTGRIDDSTSQTNFVCRPGRLAREQRNTEKQVPTEDRQRQVTVSHRMFRLRGTFI
jgi:hypothetical protein